MRHSLHRPPREARTFHAVYAGFVALGATAVLVPGVPLGAIVTGSQALAAILLPSATVFLLLLGNDAEILGPWVNPAWLNALGTLVVSAMFGLSAALVAHALVPGVGSPSARPRSRCCSSAGLAAWSSSTAGGPARVRGPSGCRGRCRR